SNEEQRTKNKERHAEHRTRQSDHRAGQPLSTQTGGRSTEIRELAATRGIGSAFFVPAFRSSFLVLCSLFVRRQATVTQRRSTPAPARRDSPPSRRRLARRPPARRRPTAPSSAADGC